MRILVVEDNDKIAKYVKLSLEEEGFLVDHASDGVVGERLARSTGYDLIILDVMLPFQDGVTVCNNLRSSGIQTPILMLTAKGELKDKIAGFESGADDYLVKPFNMKELILRSRVLLRRPKAIPSDILSVQDISIDFQKHIVYKGKKEVPVTLKEYDILEHLMKNAGIVVTRSSLLEHCWDFAYTSFSNITDVYIRQLRKKLNDKNEKYIETIRGVGYKFKK